MATTNPKINLSGLARRLVQDGLVSDAEADEAFNQSAKKKIAFVTYLVQNDILNSLAIANAASQEFGVPLFDLDAMDMESSTTDLVDEKLIRRHHALPLFKRGNRLYVAVSDPTNLQAMDEIKFHVGCNTEPVLVEEDKLAKTIDTTLAAQDAVMTALTDDDYDDLDITSEDEDTHKDDTDADIDDTPIVRFVNKVLLDAINKGASDIHFEPYEKTFRVRFRQDGMLRTIAEPPTNIANRVTARLKVLSRLDISERRVPQDGRMKMKLSRNRAIDFRVNTLPTLYGEKVVLRILDPASASLGIEVLGYEDEQRQLFMDALAKPYGMILVTGPTGSGKTVSLYTGLGILNTEDRNISTAEDPVEINMPGVNQVNVNNKVGLTFATALRAFLRQDPDVVMVGEIRDIETAEIAIKAAQTGHLVLSTLHTNDAPQTLTRLGNMGVAPFNIASSVVLIIAQRLARRLCPHCKTSDKIPKEALLEEGFTEADIAQGMTVYKAVGCDQCSDGYKGRVGIYQVMPISEEMAKMIMEGGNSLQLEKQSLQEGIPNLRMSGLKKVKNGVTSLEEINRVTKD